jgi:hypothetical protein
VTSSEHEIEQRQGANRRKRVFRERQKHGCIVLRVQVNEHELAAAMLTAGHLTEAEALCRTALEHGAATVLSEWAEQWLRDANHHAGREEHAWLAPRCAPASMG